MRMLPWLLCLVFGGSLGAEVPWEFQRYDGWMNNVNEIGWGGAETPLVYLAPPAYADGVYKPAGKGRPSPGLVSAELLSGPDGRIPISNSSHPGEAPFNLLFVAFGQAVSGEIMATISSGQGACPIEKMKLKMMSRKNCPGRKGGSSLDCLGAKKDPLPQFRVAFDQSTGRFRSNPRKPLNFRSAWIDASYVYSEKWLNVDLLRAWDGSGRLKSDAAGNPKRNEMAAPILNPPPPALHPQIAPTERQFLVGSAKANQEPGLLSISIILHRWHNHLAAKLQREHPDWDEETLFQMARRWSIASLQQIVVYEFLPALLGAPLPPYKGYNPDLSPAISAEFQGAAYRWGHSLVPSGFYVADENCSFRAYPFCKVWWNSQAVMEEEGLEAIVRGSLAQAAEAGDHILAEGVRERLFGGLLINQRDLGALNIQRGRDEGLADFNSVRHALELPKIDTWRDLNPELFEREPDLLAKAEELYGASMDDVDLFVGGLLEAGGVNGRPGPTFAAIIREQFIRLRDSDRFWFERGEDFDEAELAFIKDLRFADVIAAVTNLSAEELGRNVFLMDGKAETKRCRQPSIITSSSLPDNACPMRKYDFFTGSRRSFVAAFASLALFPLGVIAVCLGAGKLKSRYPGLCGWSGAGEGRGRSETGSSSVRATTVRGGASRRSTVLTGVEYNGNPTTKGLKEPLPVRVRVKIEVSPGPVVSLIRSEVSRRIVDCSRIQSDRPARISEEDGPDFLFQMAIPMSADLLLFFSSAGERAEFVHLLDAEFLAAGKLVNSAKLPRETILANAMTPAKRQELLRDFFTTAFHQVHAAQQKQHGRSAAPRWADRQSHGHKDLGRVRLLLHSRIPATLRSLSKTRQPQQTGSVQASRTSLEEGDSPRKLLRRALVAIELSKSEFADAMQLRPDSVFVQQMFRLADVDQNGTISYPEFIDVLALFSKGTLESKMRMLFDMYDLDGSGDLDREEFEIMIRSLLEVTGKAGAQLSEDRLRQVSEGMLHECGMAEKSLITFADFFHVITTHQGLIWNPSTAEAFGVTQVERKLSTAEFGSGSAPILQEEEERPGLAAAFSRASEEMGRRMENNWSQILWTFLYVGVSGILFAYKFTAYQFFNEHKGTRAVVGMGASWSRGAAQVISFSLGLLLLTVCRNLLAIVRSSPLGYYLPVDSALTAHRWLAASIAFWSLVHIVGHGINFYQISTQPPVVLSCLFPDVHMPWDSLLHFHFWLFQTVPGVTGVLLILAMSILYVFASHTARRRIFGWFWATHRLFLPILVLLFLHGSRGFLQPPGLHQFLAIPIGLFILDWIIRLRRHSLSLRIASAEPLPSGVLHLSLKKPRSLSYKSGQWVRVACDALSDAEFHPFTITSAPHESTLDVYIRSAGPWTKRMYALFSDPNTLKGPSIPRIILEGPYGSSHQDWFKFKAVVLVGAGIGVTPCASVIKDLVHKVYAQRSDVATRHIHFVWLSRGQQQFEWLLEVLRAVEEADTEGLVSVDIFVSQLLKDYDIRTMMLYMCEHQFQRLSGRSLFTGIRGRTHFGRIDLPAYLAGVQRRHSELGKLGVFSCGPKSVVRSVDAACTALNKANVKPRLIAYHEIF